MSIRSNQPPRPQAEMNATPMLDVLLVLLVIFMLVAMRTRHTIDAVLPLPCAAGAAAPCENGGQDIVLEVLPGPAYRLNGAPLARASLRETIAGVYAVRPSKVLQLTGRGGASYQQVIEAMDVARGAGVKVIALLPRDSTASR